MTQEDKELLLQDLCARLPYGVKIELTWWVMGEGTYINTTLEPDHIEQLLNDEDGDTEIKPYLRPMSSMTMVEFKEWLGYCKADYDCEFKPEPTFNFESCHLSISWLNQHHFDYRELIEKGLAIEAPNNMYNLKVR